MFFNGKAITINAFKIIIILANYIFVMH